MHIRIERISPENPSRVPAIISTLFERTKPVAAAASPAYEFNSDITIWHVSRSNRDNQHDAEEKRRSHHDVKSHNRAGMNQRVDETADRGQEDRRVQVHLLTPAKLHRQCRE